MAQCTQRRLQQQFGYAPHETGPNITVDILRCSNTVRVGGPLFMLEYA